MKKIAIVVCTALLLALLQTCTSSSSPVRWNIPASINADTIDWNKKGVKDGASLSSLGESSVRPEAEGGDSHIDISTLRLVQRGLYLGCLFSPVMGTSGLAYMSSFFRESVWYFLLRYAVEHSGAAFIKWGQWASTRPDMFPADLCTMLQSLQSDAPVHSWAYTQSQIIEELGSPYNEIFEEFEKKPIASGSIAQVYRAKLNGQEVAVKIRHPNVREQIKMDFILMKMVAGFVESIPGMDWINLSNSLEMFSATIASQTRLDIEGWHLNLFNNNFKRWRDVGFPKPIVVTEAVLVETFEFGNLVSTYINVYTEQEKQQRDKDLNLNNKLFETVVEVETDLERAERAEAVRKHLDLAHFLVCRGEDLYLKMLIQDNLMHADLHPGNILIQNTHSYNVINSDKPQTLAQQVHETELRKYEGNNIILVDAGMVAKLTREEQKNFVGLLAALGEGDGLMAADFVLNFSVNNNHSEELRMKFRTSMQEFFDLKCRGYYTGVNLGEVLRGVLNLCRIHKITINSNYATLVMNALCLDGLVVALLPNYNILDAAKMFFRFHTKCLKYHCLPMSRFIIPLARIIKKRTDRKFLKEEAHKLLAETLENNQK